MEQIRARIARIKVNVDIDKFVRMFGGRPSLYTGQMSCVIPGHLDKHPSARIFRDSNIYHCWVCGFHGDLVDLIKIINRCDVEEAVNWLEDMFGLKDLALPKVSMKWKLVVVERFLENDFVDIVLNKFWFLKDRMLAAGLVDVWEMWRERIWEAYDQKSFDSSLSWYRFALLSIHTKMESLLK